jgi:hypothetical protein
MKSEGYEFRTRCPCCGVEGPASCKVSELKGGSEVKVHAFNCDHSWTLRTEEVQKLQHMARAEGFNV